MEQPVRGLMSLFQQKDIPVLIAINEKGIYVIDHVECVSESFWFDKLLFLLLSSVDECLHTNWSQQSNYYVLYLDAAAWTEI